MSKWLLLLLTFASFGQAPGQAQRPRAREAGVVVGVLTPGPLNAITDVGGVLVGQATVVRGADIHSGVTAILPHGGNLFREKVPGAVFIGNAFGKLAGSTQVEELGEIETPVLLTSTVNVPRVADALIDYMLSLPGNETVLSVNPLVGETNDGGLNDIRSRPVGRDDVFAAIKSAKSGAVEEGAVGAGTGTIAFGWKGGVGTSSRKLPAKLGGYTVGVLVQSNFGGILTINGAPVGQELGQFYLKNAAGLPNCRTARLPNCQEKTPGDSARTQFASSAVADGSCMIVVATDAPLDARNLKRLAARAIMGLARTGSAGSNGSGDYVIAFSTAPELRIKSTASTDPAPGPQKLVNNEGMSPLFEAAIEATEEAIYNSLFTATTVKYHGRTSQELPVDSTLAILRRHGLLK
jgi:D-aminopeptidase